MGFHGNQFRLNFVFTTDKLERQIPGEPSFSSVKINVTNVHMAEASIFVLSRCLSDSVSLCLCVCGPYQSAAVGVLTLNSSLSVLPQELARQRQENGQLLKAQQDKDDLIGKLKEEIDLLNRVSVGEGLPRVEKVELG